MDRQRHGQIAHQRGAHLERFICGERGLVDLEGDPAKKVRCRAVLRDLSGLEVVLDGHGGGFGRGAVSQFEQR
jgi:hypothetical protein